MLFISFDVGIRNLAYIIIDLNIDTGKHIIKEWNVLELCDKTVKASHANNVDIGMNMMNQLDEISQTNNYTFDRIIIENQIGKNAIKMKTIQNMLNMYFVMRGYTIEHIINYNAVNKLKYFTENKKTTYAERKKLSKNITQQLCKSYYGEDIFLFYKSFKKKDDLADCLLQVIDYINKYFKMDDTIYKCISML